ncbi:MAG: hypothetical protein QUS09_10720, partial [Methanotrichaceae archaeon]|nr:hypothetical protein [Methanotrichaceae archaeon]
MKTVYDESTETRGYGSDMREQSHVLLDVYEGLIAGGASEEEARKRIWELLAKMGQRSGVEARKDWAQEQSSETDDSVKTYDPLAKAEESESSTQKDLSQMSAREREKEMDKLSTAAKEATAREAEEESAQMVPAVGKASPETKEAMRNGQPVSAREKAEVADDAMNSAKAEKERKAQEAALEQERAAIGQSTDVPAETREAMRNGQAVPVAAKDKVVEQSEKAANAQKQRQAAMSNPPRTEEECRKKVEELKKLGGGVTEAIEQAENEGASAHEIYYRATSRGYYPGMDPKMAPSAGSGGKGLAGLPMAEEVTAARAGTKISSGKSEDECRKANDSMAKMGMGLDEAIALARERGLSEDEINAKLTLRGYHRGMDPKLVPGVDELKGGGIAGLPTVQDITRWKKNEAAGITSKGQFAPKPKPEEEAPVQMSRLSLIHISE